MRDVIPPQWVMRADGIRLAVRRMEGDGPTVVFLPGYQSDMNGSKALALEAWAIARGRPFIRFDYAGCGESGGNFEDQTLESWRDDALLIVRTMAHGSVMLVGSSMGGWLMLSLAEALGSQIVALVGIAAAPDFTEWGYSDAEKSAIQTVGRIEQRSVYGPAPVITTRALWQSGQRLGVLNRAIEINCPLRLLHGQCDDDVPWNIAVQTARALCSDDVQIILVKHGDHRLSRDHDIALLLRTVEILLETL